MQEQRITRETTIEQLVELKEAAVTYLFDRKIRCIRCGEPIWDTIEQAARKVGYAEGEIDRLVDELNRLS